MQLNIFTFFALAITLFVDVQCLPCSTKNITRVKREADGPDIVGIGMQAAATAMEMAQQGGAIKHNFSVQHGK